MCLSCGCGSPNDSHLDRNHLILDHLHAAASAAHISTKEAAHNVVASLKHEGYIDNEDESNDNPVLSGQESEPTTAVPNGPGATGEADREYVSSDNQLLPEYTGRAHPGSSGHGPTKMSKEPLILSAFRDAARKFAEKKSE